MILSIYCYQEVVANGRLIACNLDIHEIALFTNFQGLTAGRRTAPRSTGLPELQISAVQAMSPSDNFLQKQQERRVKKGPRWQSALRAAHVAQLIDPRRKACHILHRK